MEIKEGLESPPKRRAFVFYEKKAEEEVDRLDSLLCEAEEEAEEIEQKLARLK